MSAQPPQWNDPNRPSQWNVPGPGWVDPGQDPGWRDPRFAPGWTTPPAPPQAGQRLIRGRRVALGIGLALAAHAVPILMIIGMVALSADQGDAVGTVIVIDLILEGLIFLGCVVIGIVLIVRSDRGVGVGLLIGWAVGVLVLPITGFGVCVALLNQANA